MKSDKFRPHRTKLKSSTSKIRREEPYGDSWSSLATSIKLRDTNCCSKCSSTDRLEVHHIVAVSKGGNNSSCNLITLCHSCHKKQPRHRHLK